MPITFRIPPPPRLPRVLDYALAGTLPIAALGVELLFRDWVEPIPFVLFFFVVSLVASIGGWGPGFVAVAGSAACGYAFLRTSQTPLRAETAALGALLFVPVATVIAGFGAAVRAGFREREEVALQLEEAVRAREEFIATASHELKTPLTSLSLVVQHLERMPAAGGAAPQLERHLETIRRQTERLEAIVKELLDVTCISSSAIRLDLQEVDLAAVARGVVARSAPSAEEAAVALELEAPERLVGRWDRVRLEQVFASLLGNAIRHGRGRPVRVRVVAQGASAVLAVSDEGMGIAPEDHARIFELFERGRSSPAQSGFGVGLWRVREIATALGGSVAVESAPGRGATFTVTLPLRGPPPAPTAHGASAA